MANKFTWFSFIIGVFLATALGVQIPLPEMIIPYLIGVLFLLGFISGFIKIKRVTDFLFFCGYVIVLSGFGLVSDTMGKVAFIGSYLNGMVEAYVIFLIPMVSIVGLRFLLSKKKQ